MLSIDGEKYRNEFDVDSSSNYAFIVVLRNADFSFRDRVEEVLRREGIEFRRGLSGGGNQLRQPYLAEHVKSLDLADFPNVEHVHHFGWYIGNHPGITNDDVDRLSEVLNAI